MNRRGELDGLRALAIFWVALYHFAWFWTPAGDGAALLPYGDLFTNVPMASAGTFGVSMFFVISGIVIALSLDLAPGFLAFAWLRFARLWPVMFVCGTLTFAVTSAFGPADMTVSVREYLFSIFFLPPEHVGKVLGHADWQWLDGAYWSLWVEVRFYGVAALIWFGCGNRRLEAWTVFSVACTALYLLGLNGNGIFNALSRLLFSQYQPFLTLGIALAAMSSGYKPALARTLLVAAIVQALAYTILELSAAGRDQTFVVQQLIGLCIALALPGLSMLSPGRLKWAGTAPMQTVGRASYGYYLLHQNLGISLLTATKLTGLLSVAAMFGIEAVILCAALLLFHLIEKPVSVFAHNRVKWTNRQTGKVTELGR